MSVVVLVCILLLYKPAAYKPPGLIGGNRVSPYLTHELLAQFYNNVHLEEPFELVIEQDGIADIIARTPWPKEFEEITLYSPVVIFSPEEMLLMGAVNFKGFEFVVSIVLKPRIDEAGQLHLWVNKVKVGTMNLTFIAKIVAKEMYKRQATITDVNSQDLRAQIAGALLADEPFEPVLQIEGKKVSIKKISLLQKKVLIHFAPVGQN